MLFLKRIETMKYVVGCYRSATGEEEGDIRQEFTSYQEAARYLRDELRWLSEDVEPSEGNRIFLLAEQVEHRNTSDWSNNRTLFDCGEFTYYLEREDNNIFGGLFT